mgnify:CR=1 FL=1
MEHISTIIQDYFKGLENDRRREKAGTDGGARQGDREAGNGVLYRDKKTPQALDRILRK